MKKKFHSKKNPAHASWADSSFREFLCFHWKKVRGDYRAAALWMIELLLGVAIAASIALYVDPDINVIPSPWNYLLFLLILGAAYYFYGFTRPFRIAKRINAQRLQNGKKGI